MAPYLVAEQPLDLAGVAQEELEGVGPGQVVLAPIPHAAQLVPASVEGLQALAQEEVLRVAVALRDAAAHGPQALAIGPVALQLIPHSAVLGQQPLRLSRRRRLILAGHGRLRPRQPGLEVVQVAQEALQLACLAQRLLAAPQRVLQRRPALLHLGQARPHCACLLGVAPGQRLGLGPQALHLGTDGSQVTLHA